jgi:hypothetical protein
MINNQRRSDSMKKKKVKLDERNSNISTLNRYEILTGGTAEALGQAVEEKCWDGWQLHGNPFTYPDPEERDQTIFAQAIILPESATQCGDYYKG